LILCVPNVLSPEELRAIHGELGGSAFVDGAHTAGWSARDVKKNLQITPDGAPHQRAADIVRDGMRRSAMLQMGILPVAQTLPLFNRYDVGMEYGLHVDNPVMGGMGQAVRSDIAITVFLSSPDSYDGGELMVNTGGMEYAFKLDAGAAIAYPANSLHRVTPVTRGSRRAAVVWVQSQVRDASRRELLWDLETAKRQIYARDGKSPAFDAVSRSHANLLRMWADI